MHRINNQHYQLAVKFQNLQGSLEIMTKQQQAFVHEQSKWILENGKVISHTNSNSPILTMTQITTHYHQQVILAQKVMRQNQQLKAKIIELEANNLKQDIVNHNQSIKEHIKDNQPQIIAEAINSSNVHRSSQISTQLTMKELEKWQSMVSQQRAEIQALKFELISQKAQKQQNINNQSNQQSKLQVTNRIQSVQLEASVNQVIKDQVIQSKAILQPLSQTNSTDHHQSSADFTQSINHLSIQLQQQTNRNNQLAHQLACLRMAIKGKESHIQQLTQALKAAQKEQEKIGNSINQLKSGHQELQKRLKASNSTIEGLKANNSSLEGMVRRLNDQKQMVKQQHSTTMLTYSALIAEHEALSQRSSTLQNEITNLKTKIAVYEQQIHQMQLTADQQARFKLRKSQTELNQERIKQDALKRTVITLEVKLDEQKVSLTALYDASINKDAKLAQLQGKLRQYKQIMTALKKQKDALVNREMDTIREKNTAIQIGKDADNLGKLSPNSSGEQQNNPLNDQQSSASPPSQLSPMSSTITIQESQSTLVTLKNHLLSLQESMRVLKAENQTLRGQVDNLTEQLAEKDIEVRKLLEKRELMLKQLNRIKGQSVGKDLFQRKLTQHSNEMQPLGFTSNKNSKSHKELIIQHNINPNLAADPISQQKSQYGQTALSPRSIKILKKSIKALQILIKKSQSVYRCFIDIHGSEMTKPEVRQLQIGLNELVAKGEDMKDVMLGYW